ncbi:hypothetical protein JCM7447_20820 [Corynebacterium amycolatum]
MAAPTPMSMPAEAAAATMVEESFFIWKPHNVYRKALQSMGLRGNTVHTFDSNN